MKELTKAQAKRILPGESVFFCDQPQYITKATPEGKWVAKVRRRQGDNNFVVKYPIKSFAEVEDALVYCESTRAGKALHQAQADAKRVTVDDLFKEWQTHGWKNVAEGTKKTRLARYTNHIKPEWGNWLADTVKYRHAQEWLTRREIEIKQNGGRGLRQLTEIKIDLHSMFAYGRKADLAENNPFADLEAEKQPKRRRTMIESQNFDSVIKAVCLLMDAGMITSYVGEAFVFALLTGMREGELLGLRYRSISDKAIIVDRALRLKAQNVDSDGVGRGQILPQALSLPKGFDPRERHEKSEFRVIPVTDQLLAFMNARKIDFSRGDEGLVWSNSAGGLLQVSRFQVSLDTLFARMKDVQKGEKTRFSNWNAVIEQCKDLELPPIWDRLQFRDTRNSFASYCIEVGIHEAVRMGLMGHKGKSVTMLHYTDITGQAFTAAQNQLSSGWKLKSALSKLAA